MPNTCSRHTRTSTAQHSAIETHGRFINSHFVRPFIFACSLLVLLALWSAPAWSASKKSDSLDQEQHEIESLLAKADSVELGKLSPRVFAFAECMLEEKGDAQARPYFEKALQASPWALEHQLTLGEILARSGHPEVLCEKAEMVLRTAEDDGLLKRAARLAGRTLPEKPGPFPDNVEPVPTLVLAPVGDTSIFLLHDLKDTLSRKLEIKVTIASIHVKIPEPDRTAKTQWITRTRERVLAVIREKPMAAAQLGRMGFTFDQLKNDDESFITMVRATTTLEQEVAATEELHKQLAQYENTKQWDVEKFLAAMQSALGGKANAKRWVLGVTPNDLYGGTSNFLFGVAATGRFFGLGSEHCFRADFNNELPKRERLKERLLKQSLSTIGFMLGVRRCTTPECARAYPQSLMAHDNKPSTLCPACRAEFEAVLGHKLPDD